MELHEWLPEKIGQDIWKKKYCYENETLDEWFDRVSGGNEEVKRLIKEKKFLFGGRTLANRGTNKEASFSNCYSSGYAPDSVSEIMDLANDLAATGLPKIIEMLKDGNAKPLWNLTDHIIDMLPSNKSTS